MSHFPWRDLTVFLLFGTCAFQSLAIWYLQRQLQALAIVLKMVAGAQMHMLKAWGWRR